MSENYTPHEARVKHAPRDFGFSFTASTVTLALALYVATAHWPAALWDQSRDISYLIGTVLALVATIPAAVLMRFRPLLPEVGTALVLTFALYATTQGVSYYFWTAPARAAEAQATAWPLLISQNYEHPATWRPESESESSFGKEETNIEHGWFVLTLNSNRDETDLTSPDGTNMPVLSDFYLQIDVNYLEGPDDGACAIVFGETASEHWWGLSLGGDTLHLTQNDAEFPHRDVKKSQQSDILRQGRASHIGILKHGQSLQIFLNSYRVMSLDHLDIANGRIWVAPQAWSQSDFVRCAFDNLAVRGQRA